MTTRTPVAPAEKQASEASTQNPDRLRIWIETKDDARVAGVGDFLTELTSQVSAIAPGYGYPRDLHLLSIKLGSLEIIIAVGALAISAAQLVIQLAERFRRDPVLVLYTRSIVYNGDTIKNITIESGGHSEIVSGRELHDAPRLGTVPAAPAFTSSDGFFVGRLYRIDRQYYFASEIQEFAPLIKCLDEREGEREELRSGRYLLKGHVSLNSADGAKLHIIAAEEKSGR